RLPSDRNGVFCEQPSHHLAIQGNLNAVICSITTTGLAFNKRKVRKTTDPLNDDKVNPSLNRPAADVGPEANFSSVGPLANSHVGETGCELVPARGVSRLALKMPR